MLQNKVLGTQLYLPYPMNLLSVPPTKKVGRREEIVHVLMPLASLRNGIKIKHPNSC